MAINTSQQSYFLHAGLGCAWVSIVNLILLCLLRTGLFVPWVSVLGIVVIGGALWFLPLLLPISWRERSDLLVFSVVCCLGIILLQPLLGWVVWLLYGGLFLAGFAFLIHTLFGKSFRSLVIVLAVFGFYALYVFLKSHASHIAGLYSPEFSMLGILHRDTHLQASFTNMIQKYRSFSTGAGTLALVPYHTGFYVWLSPLCALLGGDVITLLPFILRGLLFPLLLFSLLLSVPMKSRVDVPNIVVVFMGMILLTEWFGLSSNWLSETYIFALIFLMFSMACLPFFIPIIRGSAVDNKIALPIFLLCIFLAQMSKVSVGIMGLGFVGVMSLGAHGLRKSTMALFVFGVLLLFYIRQYQVPDVGHLFIVWFNFLYTFGFFIVIAPLLPLVTYYFMQKYAAYLPSYVFWGLCVLGVVGFVFANSLYVMAGSGWYFSDVVRWAGMWACLFWFAQSSFASSPFVVNYRFVALQPRKPHYFIAVMTIVVIVDALIGFKKQAFDLPVAMAKKEIEWNTRIHPKDFEGKGGLLGSDVAAVVQDGYASMLSDGLKKLWVADDDSGRTAVYIPRGHFFWSWPQSCENDEEYVFSRTQGFFFQAVLGVPILNTMPYDKEPCILRDAEYVFGQKPLEPPLGGESDAWICKVAQMEHFQSVLVLGGDKSIVEFRRVGCRGY